MIDQIKESLNSITPGQWREFEKDHVKNEDGTYRTISAGRGYYDDDTDTGFDTAMYISKADSHFIAKSPEYIAYLISEVEEMQKAMQDIHDKLNNGASHEFEETIQYCVTKAFYALKGATQ